VLFRSPLCTIPLFAREGAIFVTGEPRQFTDAPHSPTLTIRVFPGRDNEFTLYEDDGISFDYREGEYRRTRISSGFKPSRTELRIRHTEGDFLPPTRGATIIFEDAQAQPNIVLVNGQPIGTSTDTACAPCWSYDHASNRITIRIEDVNTSLDVVAYFRGPRPSDGADEDHIPLRPRSRIKPTPQATAPR